MSKKQTLVNKFKELRTRLALVATAGLIGLSGCASEKKNEHEDHNNKVNEIIHQIDEKIIQEKSFDSAQNILNDLNKVMPEIKMDGIGNKTVLDLSKKKNIQTWDNIDLSNYYGVSLVDALSQNGYPSSFESRAGLAEHFGITDYEGLGWQNILLLQKAKGNVVIENQTVSNQVEMKDAKEVIVSVPEESSVNQTIQTPIVVPELNLEETVQQDEKKVEQQTSSTSRPGHHGGSSNNNNTTKPIKPDKPSVKPEEPGEDNEKPPVKPEEPGEDNEKPSVKPEEPGEDNEKPPVKPEEPGEDNEKPDHDHDDHDYKVVNYDEKWEYLKCECTETKKREHKPYVVAILPNGDIQMACHSCSYKYIEKKPIVDCDHEEEISITYEYIENGKHVKKVTSTCKKCGQENVAKFEENCDEKVETWTIDEERIKCTKCNTNRVGTHKPSTEYEELEDGSKVYKCEHEVIGCGWSKTEPLKEECKHDYEVENFDDEQEYVKCVHCDKESTRNHIEIIGATDDGGYYYVTCESCDLEVQKHDHTDSIRIRKVIVGSEDVCYIKETYCKVCNEVISRVEVNEHDIIYDEFGEPLECGHCNLIYTGYIKDEDEEFEKLQEETKKDELETETSEELEEDEEFEKLQEETKKDELEAETSEEIEEDRGRSRVRTLDKE